MEEPVRRVMWAREAASEELIGREWLVANGLGGFASGTVAGVATRRYHGLLVAALPAPLGRVVMLSHLAEELRLADGRVVRLGAHETTGEPPDPVSAAYVAEFRLERGLPVWIYEVDGHRLEKRVAMVHEQNTVHATYRLLDGPGPLRLRLRPSVHFRRMEQPVSIPLGGPYVLQVVEDRVELSVGPALPPLRLYLHGANPVFTVQGRVVRELLYRVERERGYEDAGELWCPGRFGADLEPGGASATLVASTDAWENVLALRPEDAAWAEGERRRRLLAAAPPEAREGMGAELVLAADQFIVTPGYRAVDVARARAAGDDVRTVIAGYHWFTDWGRDTMISLEGLTLATGRPHEAGFILRTFAHYARDGLIPNMFPDGAAEGLYHTADATLWFFHAVDRYLAATGDRGTLRAILPVLREIVARHLAGTRFGIGVDAADGLVRQGEEGYQLTWMDAKVDGWVVTPRRGKAVEINALWYNALRLLEGWLREEGDESAADEAAGHAARARESFNRRFWYAEGGYLYDVVDGEGGDDTACRPNQVFAISLQHPVLEPERWEPVMRVVEDRLLTPLGLRSLAPGHPDYKRTYFGDLRTRDAAYHQGTVWGWLIGPFVDAWIRLHPERRREARRFLEGFEAHLDDFGVGTIAEIFDAEAPFAARGCISQAWSVAEVLRCWVRTAAV
ncbi:MAG TPA: amylo-alpha-1,6-glucosidase [Longimicrobium sp.]|nr:amylo-alpha-1,6-glucosidase [Longimicrobium sp.]